MVIVSESEPEWVAQQYKDVAGVYDTLMVSVPHAAWLSRIEQAARERGKAPRSVLDCACGTGLVTELLWRRGYRPVYGFDLSPAMIAIARTKALGLKTTAGLTYYVQNAATLDLGDIRVDFIVSLFDSLNYILDPNDLASAFQRLYYHTNPGGLLAFDLNSAYALSHDLFSQSQQFGPVQHIWKANWNPETRLCRVDMDFWVLDPMTGRSRHFTETHIQRAYTVPEIRDMLTAAGYVKIEAFGNYGYKTPGSRSDRLLFIAEKP